MDEGELLTRWSVRVAMAAYVASLATRPFSVRASRIGWTLGLIAYLLHVVFAFHYYHDWSNTAAYGFTARQTAATVGIDWGGGLYINYAFTLVWLADAAWWWLSPAAYLHRPHWLNWLVHGFMGFIAFNATVVFAHGFSRWFGVAACVLLTVVYGKRLQGRSS